MLTYQLFESGFENVEYYWMLNDYIVELVLFVELTVIVAFLDVVELVLEIALVVLLVLFFMISTRPHESR